MSSARQDVLVQVAQDFNGITADHRKLGQLVRFVCKRFGLRKATVSLAIVDDGRFREINRRFHKRRTTSDCLSFDLSEEAGHGAPRLFELIINGELAVKEATLRGHSSQAELSLYVTHALLHNLGFDDSTKTRAKEMHELEDQILQELGYGSVYNSHAKTRRRKRVSNP